MKLPPVMVRNGTQRVVLPRGTGIRKHIQVDSGSIKTWTKQIGERAVPMIRVPISSTSVDRDGDQFNEDGLKDLLEQLKSGRVPVYLDHGRAPGDFGPSYNVLDMQGRWIDGEVEEGVLYATAELDDGDFRALELVRKLEAGLPIGFSVGFLVRESKPRTDDDGRTIGQVFAAVDLLEVSAVGIPSNPDGVTSTIPLLAKALGMSQETLRARLGQPQEMKDMELTPAEIKQIEAQRKAALDGTAPEPEDAKDAPLTGEALKQAIVEAAKEAVAAALKDHVVKMDDEEEEEDKGDDEEEEEDKDAPPKSRKPTTSKANRPKPRGMITVQDKAAAKSGADSDDPPAAPEQKEARPFQFA